MTETATPTRYAEAIIRFSGDEATIVDAGEFPAALGWIPCPDETMLARMAEEYTGIRVRMSRAQRVRKLVSRDDPRYAIASVEIDACHAGLSLAMGMLRSIGGVDLVTAVSETAMRTVAADDQTDADVLARYDDVIG